MKIKIIIYILLISISILSCSHVDKKDSVNIGDIDSLVHGASCFPQNDSFKYSVLLATKYHSDDFLDTSIEFEIEVDSLYVDCVKKISIQEIKSLLQSEKTDFATYVLLYKAYKDFVPNDLINLKDNNIETWRSGINKKRLIEYWEAELGGNKLEKSNRI